MQDIRSIEKYLQLDWVYDRDRTQHPDVGVIPDARNPPDLEILQQLTELARDGDLDGIIEVARGLFQDANAAAFSREIVRLTEACELKQLRAFIQHYLA